MTMQKFYVIGIGPGAPEQMTVRAKEALEDADIIAGYGTYIDLVKPLFPEKEYLQNGMTGEVKRCQMALEKAKEGKTVAMISSGDSGIYGMAGLVLELAQGLDLDIETVPGITAAASGASLLGAPLMHDFAVISLSDRLTEWDLIVKRLNNAAEADFIIVLYNPRSKGRPDHIAKARDIFLQHKAESTPVGIVKNIGRDGETVILTTLGEMNIEDVDMFSTVFIGNRQTYIKDGKMITPRGYLEKKGKVK
ncbi:MAG: precorrin-3B C(17)-methyltransferase [Bacillota bacterium]|nr:precorrin-3B C(17)-methyltransferase [Bacillota bacterium]